MSRDRRFIRRVFRHFIRRLRAILHRREPAYYAEHPGAVNPCATCAFNPATDHWKGFDATMMHLQKAIEEDRPFFCHQGMHYVKGHGWVPPMKRNEDGRMTEDTKRMRLCVGWWIVFQDADTKEAFKHAVDEAKFSWPQECGGGD